MNFNYLMEGKHDQHTCLEGRGSTSPGDLWALLRRGALNRASELQGLQRGRNDRSPTRH